MEDALKQRGSLAGLECQNQNSELSSGLEIEQGHSTEKGAPYGERPNMCIQIFTFLADSDLLTWGMKIQGTQWQATAESPKTLSRAVSSHPTLERQSLGFKPLL